MLEHQALARRIGDACRLTGEFTLRSGQVSTTYFDKYLFEADRSLLGEVARRAARLIPEGTEVLAGLELGVPVATALSLASGLPAAFVRKQAKPYGTAKLAEGAEIASRRCSSSKTSSQPGVKWQHRRPSFEAGEHVSSRYSASSIGATGRTPT